MNDNICSYFERGPVTVEADGTVIRMGRCEKAELYCECKGEKALCDYYRDVRTEQKRKCDAAPYMHNVNIIIKYRKDGTYTIGWKKEMYGEWYDDYITCKADESIDEKLPRACEAFTDQISNLVETIKKRKGGD